MNLPDWAITFSVLLGAVATASSLFSAFLAYRLKHGGKPGVGVGKDGRVKFDVSGNTVEVRPDMDEREIGRRVLKALHR
jgi:hypothetical protein